MSKILIPILVITLLVFGEYYMWKAIQTVSGEKFRALKWIYLTLNILFYVVFFTYKIASSKVIPQAMFTIAIAGMFLFLVAKLMVFLVFFLNDAIQIVKFGFLKISQPQAVSGTPINRSTFLSKMALGIAAVPVFSLIYGVVVNAYNYQFKRVTVKFPNLPKSFDGFTFVQLSDIHSGSFTQTQPIVDVIQKINALNVDLILFTGDLVNNMTSEMEPFMNIFNQLKAKHGVMSITGNHDYGDYVQWETPDAKKENFQRFIQTHKELGWDLLMNENRILERNGEKIAILGIENWGKALHFPKYGKMKEAVVGTEDIPFKILMSHDPSHWDGEVRPEYADIDLTLSGHTHGFQFGIETKYFKWSPSQFVYKQWAGLYQEGKQYLYVNRGFGFLGYPGRVGILPEITVVELKCA
jgi:predicted MPP superfamily phosphohydrolase